MIYGSAPDCRKGQKRGARGSEELLESERCKGEQLLLADLPRMFLISSCFHPRGLCREVNQPTKQKSNSKQQLDLWSSLRWQKNVWRHSTSEVTFERFSAVSDNAACSRSSSTHCSLNLQCMQPASGAACQLELATKAVFRL